MNHPNTPKSGMDKQTLLTLVIIIATAALLTGTLIFLITVLNGSEPITDEEYLLQSTSDTTAVPETQTVATAVPETKPMTTGAAQETAAPVEITQPETAMPSTEAVTDVPTQPEPADFRQKYTDYLNAGGLELNRAHMITDLHSDKIPEILFSVDDWLHMLYIGADGNVREAIGVGDYTVSDFELSMGHVHPMDGRLVCNYHNVASNSVLAELSEDGMTFDVIHEAENACTEIAGEPLEYYIMDGTEMTREEFMSLFDTYFKGEAEYYECHSEGSMLSSVLAFQ